MGLVHTEKKNKPSSFRLRTKGFEHSYESGNLLIHAKKKKKNTVWMNHNISCTTSDGYKENIFTSRAVAFCKD